LEKPEQITREFKKLKDKGFKALTKTGKEIKTPEEIPDTVEELIFGSEIKYSGKRGN